MATWESAQGWGVIPSFAQFWYSPSNVHTQSGGTSFKEAGTCLNAGVLSGNWEIVCGRWAGWTRLNTHTQKRDMTHKEKSGTPAENMTH